MNNRAASQDFRDGTASGVRTLLDRLTQIQRWGVRLTPEVMNATAEDICRMIGGHDQNLDAISASVGDGHDSGEF
jgi:Mlc titration factor MtfA (ptsG expression regulator)